MVPLTDEQRAVVQHPQDRHATVLAVAGAGKTTTMVHRVRHLLDAGVAPGRVRAVMFNRAARIDFEQKLARVGVPLGPRGVRVQTFHALGLDIVRWAEGAKLLAGRRQVLEADAAQRMVLAALQRIGARDQGVEVDDVLDAIHAWKGMLTPPERAVHVDNPLYVKAFSAFEALRTQAGQLTFEDMVAEAVGLIETSEQARGVLVDRIDHLIIDEFQDVNFAQQRLARLLAGQRARVMVVGDDDQCIYEWRGARSWWIKQGFRESFQTFAHERYTLSHSFRFGPTIAGAAARVVARNTAREVKALRAHDPKRAGEVVVSDAPASMQAAYIEGLLQQGTPASEVVVLVRAYVQACHLEAALLARGVPFFVDEGPRLFVDTWPVKVQRAYLALVAGLSSVLDARLGEALALVINVPGRYVPADAFRTAIGRAVGKLRLVDFLEQQRAGLPLIGGLVAVLGAAVRPLAHQAWAVLSTLDFASAFAGFLPPDVAREYVLRQSATAALLEARAVPLASVDAFLSTLDTRHGAEEAACVRITSVFRAKGLEWDHVIMPRLVEGQFPHLRPPTEGPEDEAHPDRSRGQTSAIEAERRLFYVAVTRARQSVRMFTDGGEREQPSRFVGEVAPPVVAVADASVPRVRKRSKSKEKG